MNTIIFTLARFKQTNTSILKINIPQFLKKKTINPTLVLVILNTTFDSIPSLPTAQSPNPRFDHHPRPENPIHRIRPGGQSSLSLSFLLRHERTSEYVHSENGRLSSESLPCSRHPVINGRIAETWQWFIDLTPRRRSWVTEITRGRSLPCRSKTGARERRVSPRSIPLLNQPRPAITTGRPGFISTSLRIFNVRSAR